jgi:hypothetical protein
METAAALASDADWLPHRIDTAQGVIHFVRLAREDHRRMAFLTEEYIGQAPARAAAPIGDVAAAAPPAGGTRCHFIFHSAFCCSTLVARALDVEGRVMGLKEPVALQDLANAALGPGDPARLRPHLALALALLARPFAPGEAVVIKPTDIVTPLAAEMLAARPEARALLLYSPLPDFLRSVAKKGLFGRVWARRSLAFHGRRPAFDPGYSEQDRWLHTDLQVAALGWLHQQARFARLVREQPAGRVATLDSVTLLARRQEMLAAVDRLFGLGLPSATVAAIADGPVFARDSKSHDKAFDASAREREHAAAAQAHGDEIAMVVKWAEAVAAHVGVPMRPGAPLLA